MIPIPVQEWALRFRQRIATRALDPHSAHTHTYSMWPQWIRDYPLPDELDTSPEDAADEEMTYWADDGN